MTVSNRTGDESMNEAAMTNVNTCASQPPAYNTETVSVSPVTVALLRT